MLYRMPYPPGGDYCSTPDLYVELRLFDITDYEDDDNCED